MRADQVIIEPVLTEKTNLLREEGQLKKYVFRVHAKANKIQVKQAVQEIFEVKPLACNIINVKASKKVVSTKSGHKKGMGKKSAWKKAVVTLAADQAIDIFEGA